MRRESHVRFCECLRGKLPRATRPRLSCLAASANLKRPRTMICLLRQKSLGSAIYGQERQHFSRKLKWGPSDFSSEKFPGGYCLRRPAFVLCPPRHATPLWYAPRHGFHNDFTPRRMALYFDSRYNFVKTPGYGYAGASHTAPLSLRFLYSFAAIQSDLCWRYHLYLYVGRLAVLGGSD
jgi:hypothetical protein